MAFTTSSQETEWALFLQPRSPQGAITIRPSDVGARTGLTSPLVLHDNYTELIKTLTVRITQQCLYDDKVHRNGSMVISKAEHGRDRSKAPMTFGWRTPMRPIVCPRTTTSAQRLGKYAASATAMKTKLTVICLLRQQHLQFIVGSGACGSHTVVQFYSQMFTGFESIPIASRHLQHLSAVWSLRDHFWSSISSSSSISCVKVLFLPIWQMKATYKQTFCMRQKSLPTRLAPAAWA